MQVLYVRVNLLCYLLFVCSSCSVALEQLFERDLGSHKTQLSQKIENGYFLYKEEYIPAPYSIERIGRGVFINNKLVYLDENWPMPDLTTTEPPKLITLRVDSKLAEIKTDDKRFKNHIEHMRAYLAQHSKGNREYADKLIKYLKTMPCIEDLVIDFKDVKHLNDDEIEPDKWITIVFKDKEIYEINLFDELYSRYINPTEYMIKGKGSVIYHLDSLLDQYANELKRGGFVVYESNRPYTLSNPEDVPLMLLVSQILEGDLTIREKYCQLMRCNYFIYVKGNPSIALYRAIIANHKNFNLLKENLQHEMAYLMKDNENQDIVPLSINDFPIAPKYIISRKTSQGDLQANKIYYEDLLTWWDELQNLPEREWGVKLDLRQMPAQLQQDINTAREFDKAK